jgi:deazaflavin-dependent oxidoreductase (nitroreductase family)
MTANETPSESDIIEINRSIVEEFRRTGNVERFPGAPIVVLTVTGARSGREQVVPLGFTRDGDDVIVIASKGGRPENPAWYHNLKANPQVKVELPGDSFQAEAIVTEGDERQRLYDAQAAQIPVFAEYQTRTTRQIPVIRLRRTASA